MPCILLEQFVITIHLIDVQIAVVAVQHGPLAVISNVLGQTMRHLIDIYRAEGTLLLLSALCAVTKMALFVFVSETLAAVVRTGKLAHIQHVSDLSGDFHFLEFLLAQRAD